jgi:hypothetical protein
VLDYILLHYLINGNEVHMKKVCVHSTTIWPWKFSTAARHYNSLNLTYVIYTFKKNLIVKGGALAGIIQCWPSPSDIRCAHLALATNDILHCLVIRQGWKNVPQFIVLIFYKHSLCDFPFPLVFIVLFKRYKSANRYFSSTDSTSQRC